MFAIIHAAVVSAILVTSALLWRYAAGLPEASFGRLNARLVGALTAASGAMLAAAAMVAQFKHGHALNLPWPDADPMLRGLVIIGLPLAFCNLAAMAFLRSLAALPGGIESLDAGLEEEVPAVAAAKPLFHSVAEKLGTFLRITAVVWIISRPDQTDLAIDAQWVVSILLLVTVLIDGALLLADPDASAASRASMTKVAVALWAAYVVYGQLADGANAWTLSWSILDPAALLIFSLIAHFALRLSAKLGMKGRAD